MTVIGCTSWSPPPTTPIGHAERRAQQVVPLAHEIERRRDDERAPADVVDRQDGDVRLARAGRQHDDAASAGCAPRVERLGLVGARLAVDARAGGELGVAARVVVNVERRVAERGDDLGVRDRRRAEARRALVPFERCRNARLIAREAAQLDRSGAEGERRDHARDLPRPPSSELLQAKAAAERQDERDEEERVARDRARAPALHVVRAGLLRTRTVDVLGWSDLGAAPVLSLSPLLDELELELLPVVDFPQSHESDLELSSSSSVLSQPDEELLDDDELDEDEEDDDVDELELEDERGGARGRRARGARRVAPAVVAAAVAARRSCVGAGRRRAATAFVRDGGLVAGVVVDERSSSCPSIRCRCARSDEACRLLRRGRLRALALASRRSAARWGRDRGRSLPA